MAIAERIVAAVEALLGKADTVVENTAPVAAIREMLDEAYQAYRQALVEAAEAREALAAYFGWLIGADFLSILTNHRRMTDKDVLVMAVANGWTWGSYVDDATKTPPKLAWDWGLDVVVIVNGPDGQPISPIPDGWSEGEYRLRVELSHEAATKVGLTDHRKVWVPLKFFMEGCDLLSFDKKVLLVLRTAVAAETLTRKDADVFGELVVVKPMKAEHRLYRYIVMSLVGIRETETQPNVLAEVQEPAWTSGGLSFLFWLVDYITGHNIRGYGDCALPDGSAILGTDWTTRLKIRIYQHLCELADRIYVRHHFELAWQRRALEHKTITDALIKDCLWDHLPPTELAVRETFWRERADACIERTLEKRERSGFLDRAAVERALYSDQLHQWRLDAERIDRESHWLERADAVGEPRIARAIRAGRLYGFPQAALAILKGFGEGWAADLQVEADRLVQLALLCTRFDYFAKKARGKGLSKGEGWLAELAEEGYVKGDILVEDAEEIDDGHEISFPSAGRERELYDEELRDLEDQLQYILGPRFHGTALERR